MSQIVTRSQGRNMDMSDSFKRARAQGEALGLTGADLVAYVERKEKEEREEREKERERERERQERESEEKERDRQADLEKKRIEVGLIEAQADLERAKLGRDTNQNANSDGDRRQKTDSFRMKLPYFDDDDDIEDYLRTFERAAKFQDWLEEDWGMRLGSLLKGKAREVYTQLPDDDAQDYDTLKEALLRKFHLNSEQYRQRFRETRRQAGETTRDFVLKLERWFDRWIDMAKDETGCDDMRQLMLLERMYAGIPFDEARFIRERVPKSIDEAITFAEVFMSAKTATVADHQRHNKSNPKHRENPKHQIRSNGDSGQHKNQQTSEGGNKKYFKLSCYTCGGEHLARNCHQKQGGTASTNRSAAVQAEVKKSSVKSGVKLCDTCADIPFAPECTVLVGGRRVSALRDTGASMTIVRSDLVPEQCYTGVSKEIVLAASPEKRSLPIARVDLDSPFYFGEVEVLVMKEPVFPVLIGNYAKDGKGNYLSLPVYPVREIGAAIQTRAGHKREEKKLDLPNVLEGQVTPERLSKEQKEDPTLKNVRKLAESKTCIRNGRGKKVSGTAHYEWRNGILYRVYNNDNTEYRQVVVPKKLRGEVLRLAHDIPMSGHLGIAKTKQRIWTDFVWPGICSDVKRYCASCDVCQKTSPKGKTCKVPLGKMPVIETPFDRVAVDLIGPISPCSERGHRYILTMVDYATRYVEAKPLKTIRSDEVAEALWEMWTRLGVPKEILTDNGSQFVGELAKEVNHLLCVKGITTSPRHAQGNGLVEKYNGTIKTMLRHLCQEQPKEWDRFIPALLFAIREVPQESLKFSPFELLFGREVRGPMRILKELWTKEEMSGEKRTTFQYVVDLKSRIDSTCKLARESLEKASKRQAKYFNRKTKPRKFRVGQKVLLLVPNKRNKLQMTWKGPYVVTDKLSDRNYKVKVGGKEKTYHANILKKYQSRIPDEGTHIVAVVMIDEKSEVGDGNSLDPIPMMGLNRKEFPKDTHISQDITPTQRKELADLCSRSSDILSDLPGVTDLIECGIRQESNKPVQVRQYALPHSKVKVIGEEVDAMLKLGVIEPAASPYNAPVVLVQKKDGSNRFCIDYRKLNQDTVFDAEPMPDVNYLFSNLANKKYFSKLDLTKGYWQIPMKESDKEKTAFTTAQGQFQWKMMPFGLKNAGAVFNKMMRKLLSGLPQDKVSNFIDDVMIATETWDEHVKMLELVFQRLRENGLKAKPSKCCLGCKSVTFLGHEISEGTIKPQDDKLDKIKNAKPPKTKKELRAFLGLASYYRKFVPNFAEIATPLTDKTKKGLPDFVTWDEDCDRSFQRLRDILCSKPIVVMPDSNKQFILRTDASERGVGAVLMQEGENGVHPIAYASRKLTKSEANYSTIEKECLGVVWGVRKFEPYLFGTHFVIETDHQPLQYLRKSKTENGRLMRWAIQLQQYQFTVRVIPGTENIGADYLSRAE